MEVHAHTHTARSKWTHYLWEFLMLFLAVFCGFLAENQREHFVEHQREKKFMASLLEDLVNDTTDLSRDIRRWERMVRKADTLRDQIMNPLSTKDSRLFYRLAAELNDYNNTFLYHDRTIGQLKNAGNFRLIRKKAIADTLVQYDAWIITTLKIIEDGYSNVVAPEIRQLQDQLLNSKFYEFIINPVRLDSAMQKDPEIIEIKKGKEEILFRYYNSLYTYKTSVGARVYFMNTSIRRATNLIHMIKKEYHLE
ncbi:MAG TPA: hypothetical protein VFH08_05055 [Chitinophagaceae bacterium]|nr:hypothetical protein [Chitinophagaceae bacterium]